MNTREIRLEIFGRVQGVGFRRFIKNFAIHKGLKGYVRNLENGSVFILAQGPLTVLKQFVSHVQQGPFFSKVLGISYRFLPLTTIYESFSIQTDASFVNDQKSAFKNLGKNIFAKRVEVPLHVAIIPDGNRRWAHQRGLSSWEGHKTSASYDHVFDLINEAQKRGVKHLSFWGFSTENWKRDKREIDEVFDIVRGMLNHFRRIFVERKIQFRHFGRRDRLPSELLSSIRALEDSTKNFTDYHVYLFIDYGGRDEIVRAVNTIIKSNVKKIDEEHFSSYLDTHGVPDPDLVIRTSGEYRLSGFMPFQAAYAEYYFSNVHFPEFGPEELHKALYEFSQRKRRFGK